MNKGENNCSQQTGLSEGYIHKKYIEFKQKFPSGFVRKFQLTHLLVDRYFFTVSGTTFRHSCIYFRYITAIGAKNETEVLDLRQLLLGDAELKQTVDLVRVTHVVRIHDVPDQLSHMWSEHMMSKCA